MLACINACILKNLELDLTFCMPVIQFQNCTDLVISINSKNIKQIRQKFCCIK